jgi:hypothetical protein
LLAFPFWEGALTYEDATITDPRARAKAFTQWNHVRLYGEDVLGRIRSVGFRVEKLNCSDVFDATAIFEWGLDSNEVFSVCQKSGDLSPPVRVPLTEPHLQSNDAPAVCP